MECRESSKSRHRKIITAGYTSSNHFLILPYPIFPRHTLRLHTLPRRHLSRPRRLIKQTRPMSLWHHMAQIPPMRRIPIVLNILPARRIGQPIIPFLLPLLLPFLNLTQQRVDRIRLSLPNPLDRERGVVSCRHCTACGFDGGDCGGRGARDYYVDGNGDGGIAFSEELHTIANVRDAPGLEQLADGDGAGGVKAALGDPVLDFGKVKGLHVHLEAAIHHRS